MSILYRFYPESQGHADQDRDGQVHPDVQEQGWSPGGVEDGLLEVGRCHGKQINFNQMVTVMSLLTPKISSLDPRSENLFLFIRPRFKSLATTIV